MNNTNSCTKANIEMYNRCTNSFINEEFGEIRTVIIDGEAWFVGKDITEILGYSNSSKALSDHVDEDDKVNNVSLSSLGQRGGWLINESGLYSLILSSQMPNAKKFKRWVTNEVLPSIRKTGGYVNNDELFINTYLPFAEESVKVLFLQTLQTVRKQNATIQSQRLEIEKQKQEIVYKEDVIIGLVGDIDLATKRQRITQIVRHCKNRNYQERYMLLYSEFERKYHCNLKLRMESDILKPKAKNTMDYIDRGMNMIPELYEITCKLFENDVEELKAEWEHIIE